MFLFSAFYLLLIYILSYIINFLTDVGAGKGSGYNSIIPDAPGAESHPLTKALAEKIGNYVDQYVEAMEKASDYTGSM